MPYPGSPVIDITEISEATRERCSMATVWAIIPPIDAPSTWAALHAEVVQEADGVGGHVGERVRHRWERLVGQRRGHHRTDVDLDPIEGGGQPGVPVVEPDDVATTGRQLLAEAVIPGDQLGREPSDEEEGGVVGRAEGLELQLDPSAECCSGHG